ncbi:MAG: hypothetical protein WC262_11580 [Bacteroidales bacterium]|jgi:hypothetical protein
MKTVEFYVTIKTKLDLGSTVDDHVNPAHITTLFHVPRDKVSDVAQKPLRDLNPEELMVVAKYDFYKNAHDKYEVVELGLYIDGLREGQLPPVKTGGL